MSKRVTVLYGGWSTEREVSLVSGTECAAALKSAGFHVTLLDAQLSPADLIAALAEAQPDAVLNALHGRYGEDGKIQGLLDLMGLPYSHSGVMSSALAMDKVRTKAFLKAMGMPVAADVSLSRVEIAGMTDDPLPRPYVLKPRAEGSSVGVYMFTEGKNQSLQDITLSDTVDDWMAEAYIAGRELTVAVMSGRGALGVTEMRSSTEFYDYEAKYTDGITEHILPAPIDDGLTAEAKRLAELAHEALGCRGVSRSDFRLTPEGKLVYLETNTQPGMTPLSLVPEQAQHVGISFEALLTWMTEQATCDG